VYVHRGTLLGTKNYKYKITACELYYNFCLGDDKKREVELNNRKAFLENEARGDMWDSIHA